MIVTHAIRLSDHGKSPFGWFSSEKSSKEDLIICLAASIEQSIVQTATELSRWGFETNEKNGGDATRDTVGKSFVGTWMLSRVQVAEAFFIVFVQQFHHFLHPNRLRTSRNEITAPCVT